MTTAMQPVRADEILPMIHKMMAWYPEMIADNPETYALADDGQQGTIRTQDILTTEEDHVQHSRSPLEGRQSSAAANAGHDTAISLDDDADRVDAARLDETLASQQGGG